MARNFDDPFTTYRSDLDSPAQYAVEITPTDATVLTTSIRGLYVGVTGNVSCRLVGNASATQTQANVKFAFIPAGTILPVRLEGVWATDTTADDLIGLY